MPVNHPVPGQGEHPGPKRLLVAAEPPQPTNHRHPGVSGEVLRWQDTDTASGTEVGPTARTE